ncbi:MAG TPA: hypothetical protein VGF16_20230 [Bryobacteraceae bacterium]|jgi:uncharacterized protein (TIGR03437 family)
MIYSRRRVRACILPLGALWLAGHCVVSAQQYTVSTIAGGAPPPTPVSALSTTIGPPERVTSDSTGNLYFSALNSVFKMNSTGTLTLIAGNSRPGYSGDGGPAIQAQLNNPQGLAVDAAGDVFIADTGNHRIREVTPDGKIATFAGTGQPGLYPISGPATQTPLQDPAGVAVSNGNVYIADSGNHVIRIVTPDGNLNGVAGVSYSGFSGDGGSAHTANLANPQDVAVDSKGVVYIADTGNSRIRAVGTDGNINTVAGGAGVGFSGDGGVATSAALTEPYAISVDSQGNLYIADLGNLHIRKVDTKGNISTVAGTGFPGFSGDGGPGPQATLTLPSGVAADPSGNVFIADQWNLRVRKVDSSAKISTVAGNGGFSYSGDGGSAARAQLYQPQAVAVDRAGNVYIADSRNAVVRKVATDHTISSLPGTSLKQPLGIATDAAGNVYVSDYLDNRVKKIATDGTVSTIAGNGTGGFAGDGGPAASAQINAPAGLAVDAANNLYIADFANNLVRKVTPDGVINTVAGTGVETYSGDGGPALQAGLDGPLSLAVDAAGNLYIADTNNHVIREVTPNGIIQTIAGTGASGFGGDDGPPAKAQLSAPAGIAVDATGNLYISDGSRLRKIIPSAAVITTIAGSRTSGYSGDNGIATLAAFNGLSGVAVDAAGNLYVTDSGNNAVRLLQPMAAAMTLSAVTSGASNQLAPAAPGEIVVLYGSGLGPAQLIIAYPGADGKYPNTLGGTTVTFNGIAAPMLYTSPNQVAAVVPFGVSGTSAQVTATYLTQSVSSSIPAAATAPGLFTLDYSGKGQIVAFDQNFEPNSAANPIRRGGRLMLIATGLGQTTPAGVDGMLASTPPPASGVPPTVMIGGQQAAIVSATAIAGQIQGLMQITVQVPAGVTPGNAVPVTLQAGTGSAQPAVTIAVSQ